MALQISDTTPKNQYTATSGQTTFAVSFEFFDVADLKVFNGTTLLTYSNSPSSASQYSVIGAGVTGGGSITLGGSGATLNDVITIIRDVAIARTSDFPVSGNFPIQTLNTELDKIVAMMQQLEEKFLRTLQYPVTSTTTFNADLPGELIANKVLAINSSGDGFDATQELGVFRGNWAASTSYNKRDLVKDTSTNNVFIVLESHTSSGSQPLTTNANSAKYELVVDAATATTSATNAASSASAASTSESNAAASATTATTKATEAATSATNAATSETNAATSATTATTKAAESVTSANNAATSETNAATSATTASTQATSATNSASAAATSETNAANSATASANSATAAATSETNASNSATTATTQATNANNSATAAASSQSAAASAQTAAESARDSALASFDSFDDRYLGPKSSDPSVDNDGNALVAGALYFNSSSGAMKVYTGSAWVDAYSSGTTFLQKSNNLSDLPNAGTARTNMGVAIGSDVQAHSSVLDATTASYTTALNTKLSGIETGATADQSDAEIKTAYENNNDTNAFTDAEQTKLSGIATSATANPDTDSLSEGSTNQYFTQARARGSISVSGDLSYNSSTGVLSTTGLASSTTDDLSEGSTNLYYTDARVDARLSGGSLPSITTTGNAVIGGNLTVSGTTTTVNTETIELADNKILLNSNATGTPTENVGIEVSRGSSSNKTFQWDESTDKWTIGSETFVAGTVEGNLTGNVTGNVTGQTSDISNHSTDALSEGSSNLYFTNARATSAITGSNLDMGSNDITTTGKIKFANMYAQLSDLPSATTYHGMFAHVHATGKGYYAHGGNWIELANATDVPSSTSALSEGSNLYFTDERVDDRVNGLLQAGTNINLAYDDNANTLTISSTGSSTTASPEIYGFNYNVGTGVLQVTTTNGGQDNISSSTYATFDDVVYASTGFTWSITTTGELRATI